MSSSPVLSTLISPTLPFTSSLLLTPPERTCILQLYSTIIEIEGILDIIEGRNWGCYAVGFEEGSGGGRGLKTRAIRGLVGGMVEGRDEEGGGKEDGEEEGKGGKVEKDVKVR